MELSKLVAGEDGLFGLKVSFPQRDSPHWPTLLHTSLVSFSLNLTPHGVLICVGTQVFSKCFGKKSSTLTGTDIAN